MNLIMTEDEVQKATEFEQLQERVENLRCSIGALIVVVIILTIIETIELIVSRTIFFDYGIFFVLLLILTILNAICFFKQ
jgi:hypothetical protein